jgi:hypothetical protein
MNTTYEIDKVFRNYVRKMRRAYRKRNTEIESRLELEEITWMWTSPAEYLFQQNNQQQGGAIWYSNMIIHTVEDNDGTIHISISDKRLA